MTPDGVTNGRNTKRGDLVTLTKTIADHLEDSASTIVKQAEEARERERERNARLKEEWRRNQARERAKARQQAQEAAKRELFSIVKAWNDAFALEAFFQELSRRAAMFEGEARAALERRIETARQLIGGEDALDRFLQWTLPPDLEPDETDDESAD